MEKTTIRHIRKYEVARALDSVVSLAGVMDDLTEEEVLHCLEVESSSQRRKAVISALIRRAAKFNKQRYVQQLKEKYSVPSVIEDSGSR
jgi:hypothetical protein